MEYEDDYIAEWRGDGRVIIYPEEVMFRRSAMNRIDRALPALWQVKFRGRGMRPRLLYRGVSSYALVTVQFLPDGAIGYGDGSNPFERITAEQLNEDYEDAIGNGEQPRSRQVPRNRARVVPNQVRTYERLLVEEPPPTARPTLRITDHRYGPCDNHVCRAAGATHCWCGQERSVHEGVE
jgi:hypothetical protein